MKLTQSIHVIVVELEVKELCVGLNAVFGKTLGKDDVSVVQTPFQQNPVIFWAKSSLWVSFYA